MVSLGGQLHLDKKKREFYFGLFEIFPFENWQFLCFEEILGIPLSVNLANKVHTRKCLDYNFLILQ